MRNTPTQEDKTEALVDKAAYLFPGSLDTPHASLAVPANLPHLQAVLAFGAPEQNEPSNNFALITWNPIFRVPAQMSSSQAR